MAAEICSAQAVYIHLAMFSQNLCIFSFQKEGNIVKNYFSLD